MPSYILYADAGAVCPESGIWVSVRNPIERRLIEKGEVFPEVDQSGKWKLFVVTI